MDFPTGICGGPPSPSSCLVFGGAPFRLNAYMSRSRFDQIMHTLRYTDKEATLFFLDCFHEVRQMIDALNDHYSKGYTPL